MAMCCGSSDGQPSSGSSKKKRNIISGILGTLAFLVVLSLVLIFLVLPKIIQYHYRSKMKFANLKVSQLNLFPDETTHFAFKIEGDIIHPPLFGSYQGVFHSWKFLNEKGDVVIDEQTFEESEHPTDRARKKFSSEIKVKDLKTKDTVSINSIFNELTQPWKNGFKGLIKNIQLSGNFSLYPNLTIDIPSSLLQMATKDVPASQKVAKVVDFSGIHYELIVVNPTEKGLRLTVAYSTNDSITPFRFNSGTYPIFYYMVPVSVLILKEDIHIQKNMNRASVTIDLEFVQDYEKTGAFLLTDLSTRLIKGETSLQLQRPTSNSPKKWTSDFKKDPNTPSIEFPKFPSLVNVIKSHRNQIQPHLRSLNIIGNRVELEIQLQLPLIFNLNTLTVSLGAKFKLLSNNQLFFEVEASNLSIETKEKHHLVYSKISLIFPQSLTDIDALQDLYKAILQPQIPLQISMADIVFFQTSPSSVDDSNSIQPFVCAWCDKLFTQRMQQLSFVSEDFNFKTSLASLISSVNNDDKSIEKKFVRLFHPRFTQLDLPEKPFFYKISLSDLKFEILNQYTYRLQITLNIQPALPIALDLEMVDFILSLPNFGDFPWTIPTLKIEQEKEVIHFNNVILKSESDKPSALNLLLALLSKPPGKKDSLPTEPSFNGLKSDEDADKPAATSSKVPVLESFSQMEYKLNFTMLKALPVNASLPSFEDYLKAFTLHTLIIEERQQEEETVTLKFNMKYSSNQFFSFTTNFISFHIFLLGRQLGYIEIHGLKLDRSLDQEHRFQIVFKPNPNFFKANTQGTVSCNLQPTTVLGICNLFVGEHQEYLNSKVAPSLPIELSMATLNLIMNLVNQAISEMDVAKLHGNDHLYSVTKQIVDYFAENMLNAPSDMTKKLAASFAAFFYQDLSLDSPFDPRKVQAHFTDHKLILNMECGAPSWPIVLSELGKRIKSLKQYKLLFHVLSPDFRTYVKTQINDKGNIGIQIELKDIGLKKIKAQLESLKKKEQVAQKV